ncbi:MAG: hypothetical protein GTO53_10985 [Planctomycetales bacterium]|nr:hypothetical protein [Planctomycetales bacterium]NIN09126.1 hypothetical protein [Planctomycetales bacterium]NIN78233.1 hypothetical protein [Planctomycetales bacterium]NIO35424.1 hypothetical protein [Planctomycetales bacterium]NIP05304.1 hypothetical protein [Planctomycetales bacterium]
MLRPEKLDFRVWKATVGSWGPLNAVFKRFDKNTADVLRRKTSGLLNHLVEQKPDFDVARLIVKTLPVAAEQMSAKQYEETLELVARLESSGFNTTHLLNKALPALGNCCTAGDSFSTNLGYLEGLIGHMRSHDMDAGKPLMVAVQAATKGLDSRQLGNSILFCSRLAKTGVDPTDTLRFGLPAAATALNSQQFRLALSLATHAAQRHLNVTDLLEKQLPSVAHAVSPEQLTAGFRLALKLEEHEVFITDFFKTGLVALVEIGEAREILTRNLDLIAERLISLKKDGIELNLPLTAMTSGCEHQDDFPATLEALCRFARQVSQHNVSPVSLMQHGFPVGVSHTPATFRAALNNLVTVVVRLRGAKIDEHLLQFIIEYGMDRVAKVSQTEAIFRDNLVLLLKSFRQLIFSQIDAKRHQKALQTIRDSPDVYVNVVESLKGAVQLRGGLACIYELATHAEFDWRRMSVKRVVELSSQMADALQAGHTVRVGYDPKDGPQLRVTPCQQVSTEAPPASAPPLAQQAVRPNP